MFHEKGYKIMTEICLQLSLCVAFLYVIEGIETALTEKANKIQKVTHILYPTFMCVTIFYVVG